ncbi:MAG TPA: protein kinase [Kofleriaceae bacterium]|nr:protein kinase [Kofleriaceae bacterium]
MGAESLPSDRLIGQVLANRYQILHRLGEGAMGVVYKARHVKVGRSFAVKVLHARLLQDPKIVLRFDREAELAGRLRHANVVGVVDVGEIDGMRYMVMDFAEGPDLARLLAEAPMPAERIIRLVRQMLEGLYHAHEQGLIHRDFKPENVIVERDSHDAEMPRIVDFGIAILRDGGETIDGQGRLTTNGLVLGTPHYMAPEQAVADPIDHRIDLFALGIVVYEMLSGRLPFDGSGAEVARANLMIDPPAIQERVPYLEVDPLLEAFARRLMAKQRSARPATAKAARELLDLIDRDRSAAAVALGMVTGTYAPAQTLSVPAQRPSSAYAGPPVPATTRLKATPSPDTPVRPPAQSAPPVAPLPIPWSGQEPPTLPPGPLVFSAPKPPGGSQTSVWPVRGDHETAIQTPLDWPPSHKPKRRGWLLVACAGAVLGAAGIFAAMRRVPTPHTADPGAIDLGATKPPSTDLTAPDATPTNVTAVEPPAVEPPAVEPRPADHEVGMPGDGTTTHSTATDLKASTKHHAPRETRPHRTNSDEKPEATTTPTGTTPDALSRLYYSLPGYFNQLPKDKSQELWTRWRRFNVQALMAGPQAERDQAADQLSQIHREASTAVKAAGKSPPR